MSNLETAGGWGLKGKLPVRPGPGKYKTIGGLVADIRYVDQQYMFGYVDRKAFIWTFDGFIKKRDEPGICRTHDLVEPK